MSINFKGSTALTVENIQRSFSEANGWESIYTYKGPWAAIDAAKTNAAYVGNASRVNVQQEPGAYGVLEVSFASQDNCAGQTTTSIPDTDNWTFQPYKMQSPVEQAPYFAGLDEARPTSGGTYKAYKQRLITAVDAYKAAVQAANQADSSYDAPIDLTNYLIDFTSGMTTEQKQLARDLVYMLVLGEETYETSKYSLRNTRIVPTNTTLAVSHFYEGYQWTTNRLVDLILQQKTDATKYAICGDLLSTFAGTYWLKEAPIINELSGGKFEIVQEYTNYAAGEKSYLLFPYYS